MVNIHHLTLTREGFHGVRRCLNVDVTNLLTALVS